MWVLVVRSDFTAPCDVWVKNKSGPAEGKSSCKVAKT